MTIIVYHDTLTSLLNRVAHFGPRLASVSKNVPATVAGPAVLVTDLSGVVPTELIKLQWPVHGMAHETSN